MLEPFRFLIFKFRCLEKDNRTIFKLSLNNFASVKLRCVQLVVLGPLKGQKQLVFAFKVFCFCIFRISDKKGFFSRNKNTILSKFWKVLTARNQNNLGKLCEEGCSVTSSMSSSTVTSSLSSSTLSPLSPSASFEAWVEEKNLDWVPCLHWIYVGYNETVCLSVCLFVPGFNENTK